MAAAARVKMPVAGHTPMSVGLEHTLKTHVASIEHLTGYLEYVAVDSTQLSEADDAKTAAIARATRSAGVWNCPTLYIHIGAYNMPAAANKVVKALRDAGAGLLLGTDGVPIAAHITPAKELQALVTAGLTPYEALATGTRNVAEFFGTLDSTGTVTVGKRADLVLLDMNPLQDVGNVTRQAGVMVNGRWVARAELEARLQALVEKLGPMPP